MLESSLGWEKEFIISCFMVVIIILINELFFLVGVSWGLSIVFCGLVVLEVFFCLLML